MTAMKNTIALLLMACFILNISGAHLFFTFQKSEVKAEMKRLLKSDLKNDQLSVFTFQIGGKEYNELGWEGDDEFVWNGEMYDVIEKTTANGIITIHCINDKKETELIRNFEKLNKDASNSKNKAVLMMKLLSNCFITAAISEMRMKIVDASVKSFFPPDFISTVKADVLTPPPQLA